MANQTNKQHTVHNQNHSGLGGVEALDKSYVTKSISNSQSFKKIDPKKQRSYRKTKRLKCSSESLSERDDQNIHFVTLTYRDGVDHDSKDMGKFRQSIIGFSNRNGFKVSYVWSFEYSKRGRPHYHAIFFVDNHRFKFKDDIKRFWKHGLVNFQKARVTAACSVYISKTEVNKKPSKWFRTYGCVGMTKEERADCSIKMMAYWKQKLLKLNPDLVSCNGGMVDPNTGDFHPCPYEFIFIGGSMILKNKIGAEGNVIN